MTPRSGLVGCVAQRHPARRIAAAVLVAWLLGGCASLAPTAWSLQVPIDLPAQIELHATPFFPQSAYQCGPAALATLLVASGIEATPESLVPEVYLPARRGSLQVELIAATRRRDRLAYRPPPSAAALQREVAAGRPVLVLLNFGVRAWPIWHYAVVIGYDSQRANWLLRSGTTRRATLGARRFDGAWQRADRWSLLALAPGELPATDEPVRYLAAAAELDALGRARVILSSYRAAASRWPTHAVANFALSNALLQSGDRPGALRALEATLALEPGHVPARNNLADQLSRQGCRVRALVELARARRDAAGGPYEGVVEETRREIEAIPVTDPEPGDLSPQCTPAP